MNKMEIFRNSVFLVILFLLSTHAVGQPYVGLASVLVKEGKMAAISCVTNAGIHSEYFWRKGESLYNSTDIAFFIGGFPTDDSERFKVTQNGTLILKKVALADEGKYICRVSSEESDCHGEVFVFVQAVLQDFQLTIENCEPENSCVISTEYKKPTSLTCKATNASPSMKLKWFNGSHEIKDNIQENSLTRGPLREISSTIKDVYKGSSLLTCQAVDFKTNNDDGMFAHVQFRTPASTADISPGWIVTAILFIVGFVILFLIVIFITVWPKVQNGKDVETPNRAEQESLLTNLQTKDDELKKKSEEINKLNKALTETKADKRVDESIVTSKDKELQDKREQISKLEKSLENVTAKLLKTNEKHQNTATSQQLNLDSKLLTQKDSLYRKDLQIQKLQSNLEHVEKELTKIQNREQEISSKEGKLFERETKIKRREDEMNLNEPKLREAKSNVKRREDDMNSKEQTLTELETNLKRRKDEMDLTESEFRNWENVCKTREESLNSKDSSLRIQANNMKKREDGLNPKEIKLAGREAEIKKREDELNPKEIKLAEREAEIKKREDELNPQKIRLAEREAETRKQSLDLERKTRKFRLDLMASKDPIRINCKLVTSRTGDNARVATKEKGGQAKLKARKRWDFNPKDARFHAIYPASAEPRDLCQSIVDLVENAIDGKNSCLISHDVSGREHWTTMFGPGEGASDALVPYAITTIFKRSNELRALKYKVDVTAKFKTTSTEFYISENVRNEQIVFKLLKEGNIDQLDGSTDHFVRFCITTETDQETITGTLVLVTIGSIQMIKECFLSEEPKSQLTQNISAIISDSRCRSVLITHIHEDKVDETKDCLAMVNAISKKNKKYNY